MGARDAKPDFGHLVMEAKPKKTAPRMGGGFNGGVGALN